MEPVSDAEHHPLTVAEAAAHEVLVLRHLPQVHQVARGIAAKLPGHVVLADLIGAGVLGLIHAINKFNPEQDASLSTYAQFRIRGAILDSLRSEDWAPRRLRLMGRRVSDARHELSVVLHRLPTEAEIAAHLGATLSEYRAHLVEAHRLNVISFSDPAMAESAGPGLAPALENIASPDPTPLEVLLGREETTRLAAAVEALPPAQRQVIDLYYLEELTMRDIGLTMGLGESRICQIHRAALEHLKIKWDRRRASRRR